MINRAETVLERKIHETCSVVRHRPTNRSLTVKTNDPKRLVEREGDRPTGEMVRQSILLLQNEYECLQQAAGPHVPEVLDLQVGIDEAVMYVKYVPGMSIDEVLNYLSENQLFWALRQTAEAADHVRKRGILHNDIKLANIVIPMDRMTPGEMYRVGDLPIDLHEAIQLIDYGASRIRDKSYTKIPIIHEIMDVEVAAPEQLDHQSHQYTDNWQMAATALLALAPRMIGPPPFKEHYKINRNRRVNTTLVQQVLDTLPMEAFPLQRMLANVFRNPLRRTRPEMTDYAVMFSHFEDYYKSRKGKLFIH